ncbi:MAG: prepilin-type N-terminal cleavage/methylation domain-containing protein [Methylococcaceae bacterium]|nr:prepilin-type N-terminal cleavage/methylation domain-containing protein [Methylococcaceae bacterium]
MLTNIPVFQRIKAFTLVELMVVVTIIGIFSAIAIPKMASFLDDNTDKQQLNTPTHQQSQTPAPTTQIQQRAVIPTTALANIKVKLATSNYIHNLDVYTLYDADFSGEFVFKNLDESNNRIQLNFPFPPNTTQASNVALKLSNTKGVWFEPEGVVYSLKGIRWFGELNKDEVLKAKVTYGAQGYNQYVYEGHGAGRAGSFKLSLTLEGVTSEFIPAQTLKPTTIEAQKLIWDFKNLVTDRKIIVELPGMMSPIGRIILLAKLAGLAVFLFGAAFLYLSEFKQAGRLDEFRWGHFLLLALNYFLFFIIFMTLTLGGELQTVLAIIISAALSLPLLMLHVSRILDKNFAFTHVLPMAIYTLAIVINGVYGAAYRDYIFIALTVIAISFFTLTYKTWAEKRKAYFELKQQQAEAQIQHDRELRVQEKRQKEQSQARVNVQKNALDTLKNLNTTLRKVSKQKLESEYLLDEESDKQPTKEHEQMKKCLAQLSDLQQRAEVLNEKQEGLNDIEEIKQHGILCAEIVRDSSFSQQQLNAHLSQLNALVNQLKRGREQQRLASKRQQNPACIACGFSSPHSEYCPHCGVLRPLEIECSHCGEVYKHPRHLIIEDEVNLNELHCMVCGAFLNL